MKRPLALLSLSFIFGILLSRFAGFVTALIITVVLCSAILPVLLRKLHIQRFYIVAPVIMVLAGAAEYTSADYSVKGILNAYYGQLVGITGMVISEPQVKGETVSYIIKVSDVGYKGKNKKIQAKILLTTLKAKNGTYDYGQILRFTGTPDKVKGRRNPGGFDYRDYLAQSGISAAVFARAESIKEVEAAAGNILLRTGLKIRSRIIDAINRSLPQKHAGLLNGMLIGYKGGLDDSLKKAFSDSGISHIMAVSGANVAFIALPLLYLLKKLHIKKRTGNLIVVMILLIFILVTGFEASVLRAVIMAAAVLTGGMFYRAGDIYTSISFAAFLMVILNPYTIFNIGFQLSYAATLSLVLFHNSVRDKLKLRFLPDFAADVLASTMAVQIGVLPVSIYYFNKISLVSIFTNVLVVPVTGLITVIGLIMAGAGQLFPAISELLGYINIVFLAFIIFVSELSASLPFAVLNVVTPSFALLLSYYFLLVISKINAIGIKLKIAVFSAIIITAVVFSLAGTLVPKELEVVFIDVGQGDSVFIRTASGKTVLIDGGGKLSASEAGPNPGETVVLPFLLDYGVSRIDIAVATHAHGDHIQGLFPVLEAVGSELLLIPDSADKTDFMELLKYADRNGIKVEPCAKNDIIFLDENTYMEVLHPSADFKIDNSPLNNSSLVLKLVYKDSSILLTGDIEAYAEEILLKSGCMLEADVLKVAHHGSFGSSTPAFVSSVQAGAAIISVGKNNFGHPSQSVIDRFHQSNTNVYRTDELGAVILRSDGKRVRIKGFIR